MRELSGEYQNDEASGHRTAAGNLTRCRSSYLPLARDSAAALTIMSILEPYRVEIEHVSYRKGSTGQEFP